MNTLKVTIHSTGNGTDALTGKEGDGLTVTFEDNTIRDTFLSWKSFRQLCSLKLVGNVQSTPFAVPVDHGTAA